MAYSKNQISEATQQMWASSGLNADQTATSAIDYAGAKSLTLNDGEAYLCSFEGVDRQTGNPSTFHFGRWSVTLDNGVTDKESSRQLFKGVYMVLPKNAEVKDFSIRRANGETVTVKGIEYPTGAKLLRRFPSLNHQISGHVPFKEVAQTINLKEIDNAVVMSYDINGHRFLRIVDKGYAIEA